MSVILEKTFLTRDEEYGAPSRIGGQVEDALEELKSTGQLDTYNEEFVIILTVRKVDNT